MSKTLLIVGTGTIACPLISLLTKLKNELGIDEVYFHKHTPLTSDKAKVIQLLKSGARLCTTSRKKIEEFQAIGLHPECVINEALNKADVVVDCTPSGEGIRNKERFYEIFTHNTRGFIAQGSEHSFGKPYAYDINDSAIGFDDQFIQVVSCNAHNIACLVKTLAFENQESTLSRGNFIVIRRTTDISQPEMIAAPMVNKHDGRFGTHHARDVHRLFETIGQDLNIFSSSITIPTQYMHVVQFNLELTKPTTLAEITEKIKSNPLIAITEKMDTGTIFSFARDHSPLYGRLLNQAIIPLSALHVESNRVIGFSFTSQDGNSLLSSVVAVERYLYPDSYKEKIKCLENLVFEEV
jgi:glyceraldehyde-3-phosphate dehydrogenase (NAD(P))